MMYKLVNGELKQFVLYKYSNFDGIVGKNNLITNGDFNLTPLSNYWSSNNSTPYITTSNNLRIPKSPTSVTQFGVYNYPIYDIITRNHTYYVKFSYMKVDNLVTYIRIYLYNATAGVYYFVNDSTLTTNVLETYEAIITLPIAWENVNASLNLLGHSNAGDTGNIEISKGMTLIDLTDIFGAGNEPTTVAELKADLFNRGKFMMYKYNSSLEKKGAF